MHYSKYLSAAILVLAATLTNAQPVTLAVSDLSAQGVKESEATVISEQLRSELMKSQRIRLIERSQMQEILKEQGFQQSGCTGDACAVEVGQLLGVKNIVVGSVGMAGSYTVLSVRIIDVATGRVVVNESIRTKGGIDKLIELGIGETAHKLTAGLFPEDPKAAAPTTGKKRRSFARAMLIGSGAAVFVGGGIAAAVLLSNDEPTNETTTPNARIDLP